MLAGCWLQELCYLSLNSNRKSALIGNIAPDLLKVTNTGASAARRSALHICRCWKVREKMKEPLGQDFFFYVCKSNFQTFQIMIFYAPYVVVFDNLEWGGNTCLTFGSCSCSARCFELRRVYFCSLILLFNVREQSLTWRTERGESGSLHMHKVTGSSRVGSVSGY